MFDGIIVENIFWFCIEVVLEVIIEVVKLVDVYDLIVVLFDGYNMVIGCVGWVLLVG